MLLMPSQYRLHNKSDRFWTYCNGVVWCGWAGVWSLGYFTFFIILIWIWTFVGSEHILFEPPSTCFFVHIMNKKQSPISPFFHLPTALFPPFPLLPFSPFHPFTLSSFPPFPISPFPHFPLSLFPHFPKPPFDPPSCSPPSLLFPLSSVFIIAVHMMCKYAMIYLAS